VELHRQELPPSRRPEPPQRVPEPNPPLLGDWFIYLSIIVLICGVIAISALEFGSGIESPIVWLPGLIACVLLVIVSADAAVRVWRSAGAWMPVDRNRAYFRYVWFVVLASVVLVSVIVAFYLLPLP
jgi:hypothetical protein